jgi:DNA-binding transcriptional LysR family regulator
VASTGGELRLFLEVAKAKSFNNAAKRLNVSHPTVAQGAPASGPDRRAASGLDRARHQTDAVSLYAIASGLQEDRRRAEATLRVSITDGLNAFFAVPTLEAFSQKNPNIHLHMKSATNLNDVRENQTD